MSTSPERQGARPHLKRIHALSLKSNPQWSDWRWQLREAVRSPSDLVSGGWIEADTYSDFQELTETFKTLITPYYLSLIDTKDPTCPIRKQAIPSLAELKTIQGERADPIGDTAYAPTSIIVHRYPDRALLFPTFECPMFCRYCFRKETLNDQPVKLHQALPESLKYLKENPQIKEVILSGGDPLILSTARLNTLITQLIEVGIKRLRIHSRTPVTLPQRITPELSQALAEHQRSLPMTLITHFNHPQELSEAVKVAVQRLRGAGLILLNQSVLLQGVNDQVQTLMALSHGLADLGVIPYYLHHPDLTRGTHHFRRSLSDGLSIYRQLRGRLSGYLIPRYVIEIPGGGGKIEVDSQAVRAGDLPGEWWLESPLTQERYHYFDLAHE